MYCCSVLALCKYINYSSVCRLYFYLKIRILCSGSGLAVRVETKKRPAGWRMVAFRRQICGQSCKRRGARRGKENGEPTPHSVHVTTSQGITDRCKLCITLRATAKLIVSQRGENHMMDQTSVGATPGACASLATAVWLGCVGCRHLVGYVHGGYSSG